MKKLIIILAAIAMVGAFTVSAMAAEWNFYGSARFATFYTTVDDGNPATDDASNLQWDQQGNSRIGANVKFNDEIGGRFEMSDSFGKRILYGSYNFGAGSLLIGQYYTPVSVQFYSNSVYAADGDLLNIGQYYLGRQPMIQLTVDGFHLALVKPNVATSLAGATSTEVKMPRIEAWYRFKTDMFFIDVKGAYQTYKELNTTIGDQDVGSWMAGIGGGVDIGPMFVKVGVHVTQNSGQMGGASGSAAIFSGEVKDNDGVGYLGVVGFKASDALTIEAGYGSEKSELDVPDINGGHEDETIQYYLNASYTITPGFFVVPEIGKIDEKTDGFGNDEGDTIYAGLKWQINF